MLSTKVGKSDREGTFSGAPRQWRTCAVSGHSPPQFVRRVSPMTTDVGTLPGSSAGDEAVAGSGSSRRWRAMGGTEAGYSPVPKRDHASREFVRRSAAIMLLIYNPINVF